MLCIVGVCATIGMYITLHAYQWDMRADMTKGCCMWRVYTYNYMGYIYTYNYMGYIYTYNYGDCAFVQCNIRMYVLTVCYNAVL